jgi:hypothetical protein
LSGGYIVQAIAGQSVTLTDKSGEVITLRMK